MEVLELLDELCTMLETARAVPMSNQCMVNRYELLGLLDELRDQLPTEMRQAQALLAERDKLILAGENEARRIIDSAEAEHARLVSIAEVTASAEHQASLIVEKARIQAQRMQEECHDYVDNTLANFEKVVERTLSTVQRGRDKLRTLSEIGSFDSPIQTADADETHH